MLDLKTFYVDKPKAFPIVGDYITVEGTDGKVDEASFGDQEINWYTSTVMEVNGNKYKMEYDDSWYVFNEFVFERMTDKTDTQPSVSIFRAIS